MDDKADDITRLLIAWRNGEEKALDELMPLVHRELKRIARNFMRRQRVGNTLQTTALVNEAFVRLVDADKINWQDRSHFFAMSARLMRRVLVDADKINWQDRSHFFAMSARLMRRVLVDAARRRNSDKRGGDQVQVTLSDAMKSVEKDEADVIALDEALRRLAELNQRHCQIVELRYFGGLTEDEIAETLGVSARTVRRDWNLARAWLYRELK